MGQGTYLVRFGVMAHVGRFSGPLDGDAPFQRGQFVVIETARGVELGEVLALVGPAASRARRQVNDAEQLAGSEDCGGLPPSAKAEILRPATAEEIARAEPSAQDRAWHLQLCERGLQQFDWPWALVDVETLLDDRTLVVHYLGPHGLDSAPVRAWFRTAHDVDLIFEPVGIDASSATASDPQRVSEGHGCGAGGCGHGGCASESDTGASVAEPAARGCGTSAHSGCSSCGIMRAMAERSQRNGSHAGPGYVTSPTGR